MDCRMIRKLETAIKGIATWSDRLPGSPDEPSADRRHVRDPRDLCGSGLRTFFGIFYPGSENRAGSGEIKSVGRHLRPAGWTVMFDAPGSS